MPSSKPLENFNSSLKPRQISQRFFYYSNDSSFLSTCFLLGGITCADTCKCVLVLRKEADEIWSLFHSFWWFFNWAFSRKSLITTEKNDRLKQGAFLNSTEHTFSYIGNKIFFQYHRYDIQGKVSLEAPRVKCF